MASLTETAWDARGKTVLYIPHEDVADPETSAKQKDLVQRLNSTLIHWTRQVPGCPLFPTSRSGLAVLDAPKHLSSAHPLRRV
eukprot:scaffold23830_cov28-Tisochrysis_lutea.AAC.2